MEHELVFFLMQTAVPRHQLRSAFMRNSVHGWVYLETTMNKDLVQHLLLSPGVVRRNTGIIWEQLDFADWTKVLSQLSSSGYWGTTTLSGSRSWSWNSRSCCSRASNGRDLASTCVLRPRLEELVSLNFRGTELRSRRRIGLRSELRLSYNIQTGETTEVELRFIYADRTE